MLTYNNNWYWQMSKSRHWDCILGGVVNLTNWLVILTLTFLETHCRGTGDAPIFISAPLINPKTKLNYKSFEKSHYQPFCRLFSVSKITKSTNGVRAFSYFKYLSCGTISNSRTRKQKHSLLFRVGIKFSDLIKLIVDHYDCTKGLQRLLDQYILHISGFVHLTYPWTCKLIHS